MPLVLELVPVAVLSALMSGLLLVLLPSLCSPLMLRLNSGERGWRGLALGQDLALIIGLFVGGVLADRVGVETSLIVGALAAAVALSLLALQENYGMTLAALLVFGLAAGVLVTGSALLMMATAFPNHPGAAISLGWILVSLASALTPSLVDRLLERLRLRRTLLLLALLSLLPALAAVLTPSEQWPANVTGTTLHLLHDPVLWLCGLIFFLYAPVEAGLASWAAPQLRELGYQERSTRWLLIGFWTTFLVARLVTALWISNDGLPDRAQPWALLLLGLLVGVALGNLAGTAYRPSAAWGLVVVGFLCGPLFPILADLLLRRCREGPATAFGTMYALGTFSSICLVPWMAAAARQRNVRRSLQISLVACLLLTAATLVLGLTW